MIHTDTTHLNMVLPLLEQLADLKEVCWFNSHSTDVNSALPYVGLTAADVAEASARLRHFAPYLMLVFPQTRDNHGLIESPLTPVPDFTELLSAQCQGNPIGTVYIKQDNCLPIAGSIKARGGIYEVLTYAEELALDAGMIRADTEYSRLMSEECRAFFSQYHLAVGSTGNLGLSVGIMGAKLGFRVTVHLSADAREWKKHLLRQHGVMVREYQDDYSSAVKCGREAAERDPACRFIDDENSKNLFLGYAVAGERLKTQFDALGIRVDKAHPLFVYLPCGVGGGPGGVTFGLKLAFGNNVHCLFAEPTHSPSMLLGVYTGLHDGICVQDIGLDNKTAADGLAVGRPSGFVGRAMERMIDGFYTISDERMFQWLRAFNQAEHIALEPSAAVATIGPIITYYSRDYLDRQSIEPDILAQSTHVIWATGGGLVPRDEMDRYLQDG